MYKYFIFIILLLSCLIISNADSLWSIRKNYKTKTWKELYNIAIEKTKENNSLLKKNEKLRQKNIELKAELSFYRSRKVVIIIFVSIFFLIIVIFLAIYIFLKFLQ